MAESVCVGVRVRPFNDREKGLNAEVCISMDGPTTTITDKSNDKDTPFTFDESFWSHDGFVDVNGYSEPAPGSNYADQRYVFETFGKRVLDNAWEGFHCCLFAYGQTGAGKSYSMVGYGKNKGIVPISCEEIFLRIEKNDIPDKRYEVTVSMIEIYNETVQDLLIMPEDRPKKGLDIRENKLLGIYIDGVIKRPVENYPAIEATIDEATSHRTVGSTLMNATSSRAHTVQTIEFKQVERIGGKDQVKISMINLIDLAGSEKAGQTGASGDRLKEGAMINKSLSALGNVIEKLAEKSSGKGKNVLIPYRDSKLTRLLQNALGGSSKTIMICALSPASSNYEETLSTLRYADRAKKIKNNATVNENPQDKLLRELREENQKLKQMMENLTNGGVVDTQAIKDMNDQQREIAEVEKALAEMEKSFEDRVKEAKDREEEQKERKRRTLLAINRGDIPMLVNLNEDMQLTGRVKYNLDNGKVMKIGGPNKGDKQSESDEEEGEEESNSDSSEDDSSSEDEDAPDITLYSEGIHYKQARITNKGGTCWIHAESPGVTNTWINGISLETLLNQQAQEKEKKNSVQEEGGDEQAKEAGNDAKDDDSDDDDSDDDNPLLSSDDDKKKNKEDEAEGAAAAAKEPEGIKLQHGDRVVFARSYFFFCMPNINAPEMMIVSGQVDYSLAHKELQSARRKQTKTSTLKFNPDFRKLLSMKSSPSEKTKKERADGESGSAESSDQDSDYSEGLTEGGRSLRYSRLDSITSTDLFDVLEKTTAELNNLKAQLKAKTEECKSKDEIIEALRAGGATAGNLRGSVGVSGFPGLPPLPGIGAPGAVMPGMQFSPGVGVKVPPNIGTANAKTSLGGADDFTYSPSTPGTPFQFQLTPLPGDNGGKKPTGASCIDMGFGDALRTISYVEATLGMLADKKRKRAKRFQPRIDEGDEPTAEREG